MEILFIILKIIGILLAILLLLGVAVVVVPARYRVEVISQDEVKGKIIFHWLLHFVDVRICYVQKEISYKLRIFGIPIPLDREKKEKPAKGKKEKQPEEEKSSEKESLEEKNLREKDLQENNGKERRQRGRKPRQRKGTFFQNFQNKCRAARQSIGQRVQSLKNGTTTLKQQVTDIKNLILEETNQNALRHLLQEFRYLLGRYAPRKASGSIQFSMGDPARTGKVLGNLSIFPFWSRYKLIVMPEFDSESFFVKGQICIKGHVRLWHVLVSGIRLIKDKNIRKLVTSARK